MFLILRQDGFFYSGERKRPWTRDMEKARRFSGGPDPYADAKAVSDRLRGRGAVCNVAGDPRRVFGVG